MDKHEQNVDRVNSISSSFRQRINNTEEAAEKDAAEREKADEHMTHDVHELADAQKFVGGVDVKKDAETEEDFVPTPEADSFEETRDGGSTKTATKKTAAKKS